MIIESATITHSATVAAGGGLKAGQSACTSEPSGASTKIL